MKLSRLLLLALTVATLAGVAAMVLGRLSPGLSLWVEVSAALAFIIAGAIIPAAVCATLLEQGRLRRLMWSGIISATIAGIGWAGLYIYSSQTWGRTMPAANVLMLPTIWAFTCMMSALLIPHRAIGLVPAVVGALALVASVASAFLIGVIVWSEGDAFSPSFQSIFFVCIILASFGTMTSLVLQRLPQLAGEPDDGRDVKRMPVHVWCPRCGVEQQMLTGGANCERCGLSIAVKVP